MYKLIIGTTEFELDDEIVNFESGLPGGTYKMNDVMSNGGIVSGTGLLAGRVVEVSKTFIRSNETARQKMLDWFTQPAYVDVYLEKSTTDGFTGRTKVNLAISGGENYALKEFIFSDAVPFSMYAADPYFTSTSLSSTTVTLTSSTEHTSGVTISGAKNYCRFSHSSTTAFTVFQVKTDEDYGFRLEHSAGSTDTIEVFTTNSILKAELNGDRITGGFSANSTPFELNSSANTLYITGSTGLVTISYFERRL